MFKSKIEIESPVAMSVIFGGGIGFDANTGFMVSVKNENDKTPVVKLSLYELCHPVNVGEERKDGDVMNPRSPQCGLIFGEEASIDAVIAALTKIKGTLTRHKKEFADERARRERRGEERRNRRREHRNGFTGK